MAASIPTKEPASLVAGDTIKWTRSLTDYPASDSWVLTYVMRPIAGGGGLPISFSSTASGGDHLISVGADVTIQWLAGEYAVQAYVSKSGERYQVWEGSIVVDPDFGSAGQIDTRSKARRILDFIDASFEKLVAKQAVEATIEGVSFKFRSLKELQEARNYWAPVVAAEVVASGSGTGKKRAILAVFSRPG